MSVKFITCYPTLPQGLKVPCGIAIDKEDGQIREIVCPELSEEQCRTLRARWNDGLATGCNRAAEEDILQFIQTELSRAITEA